MQQATNIRNIIFDYGGVIIDLDMKRFEESFKKLGVQHFDKHFTQLKQTPLFDDFDRGKVSEREFRDRLNNQLGTQFSDEQIDDAWNSMISGIRQDNLRMLGELYPDFRMFLLSNTNMTHLRYITKYLIRTYGRANIDSYFDKVYYSFIVGHRKPEPEIFLKVINDNNLKSAETLFIDDSPQHIEGANSVGLNAVHFTSSPDLRTFMENYFDRKWGAESSQQ